MKDIFLVNYSVKGIKTLDKLITLSFYKKTFKNLDIQRYNVKGIYGMNGSGKSGIVTSVDILRNILVNPGYLNNPIVQNNLDAMINKKLESLFIEVDFFAKYREVLMKFNYKMTLSKSKAGKYEISYEQLSLKKVRSKSSEMEVVFEVVDGEIKSVLGEKNNLLTHRFLKKTINLLENTSVCALFYEKVLLSEEKIEHVNLFFYSLITLFVFGKKLHVFLDQSDDHREYFVRNSLRHMSSIENYDNELSLLASQFEKMNGEQLNIIATSGNVVAKEMYEQYEAVVNNLYKFIRIFKADLKNIEIDRKEDQDVYICNLVMVYDSYRINTEFESTGIKKLIKLYAYLNEMVQGGIVFIDEFDSNLHDVYLCALLEYLMTYAKGQLCFTTHNVGPMDILKQNKKSIEFLSTNGEIYSWTVSGNYSPSNLYRKGMIEGSPFNVDSTDFIGDFDLNEEDE